MENDVFKCIKKVSESLDFRLTHFFKLIYQFISTTDNQNTSLYIPVLLKLIYYFDDLLYYYCHFLIFLLLFYHYMAIIGAKKHHF